MKSSHRIQLTRTMQRFCHVEIITEWDFIWCKIASSVRSFDEFTILSAEIHLSCDTIGSLQSEMRWKKLKWEPVKHFTTNKQPFFALYHVQSSLCAILHAAASQQQLRYFPCHWHWFISLPSAVLGASFETSTGWAHYDSCRSLCDKNSTHTREREREARERHDDIF